MIVSSGGTMGRPPSGDFVLRRLGILAAYALSGVAIAGSATQPAKHVTPDPSMKPFTNATYHFGMLVPKVWKVQQSQPKLTVFTVPGPGSASGGGLFVVLSANAVPGKDTLDAQVESKKKTLEAKKAKLTKDEKTTLDHLPAWSLGYDLSVNAKQRTTLNGKPVDAKDVVVTQRCTEVLCVKGPLVLDLTYICEASSFPAREKLANQVIGTFEWTDEAPAAKPGDTK
jgi:hypothetical protein